LFGIDATKSLKFSGKPNEVKQTNSVFPMQQRLCYLLNGWNSAKARMDAF